MNKAIYLIALLISFSACSKEIDSYISLIPTQEELAGQPEEPPEDTAENPENPEETPGDPSGYLEAPSSISGDVPYSVPSVKTADEFPSKVYIDPSYTGGNSNGSIDRPYTSINRQFSRGVPANTAILIKRGTTLNEKIGRTSSILTNMVYNNNFIGAYGTGPQPIVNGIYIVEGTNGLTIRDLNIQAKSQHGYGIDGVVTIALGRPTPANVTIAFNEISGIFEPNNTNWHPNFAGPGPFQYPVNGIKGKSNNLTIFNNHIHTVWNSLISIHAGDNLKIVRNYLHGSGYVNIIYGLTQEMIKINHQVKGNGISCPLWHNDFYLAGNYIDKSNTPWAAAFSIGFMAGYETNDLKGWYRLERGHVYEYNTFIAGQTQPRGGMGGFINSPAETYLRYNLFDSTDKGTKSLGGCIASGNPNDTPYRELQWHFQQTYPVYWHDNHFIKGAADITWPYTAETDAMAEVNNELFQNWSAYQRFLQINIPVGSDIDPNDFWKDYSTQ